MSNYGAKTVDDFCASVGIGRSTFYKLVADGRIKAVRSGRKTLVRDEDARAWLDSLQPAMSPQEREIVRAKVARRGRRASA